MTTIRQMWQTVLGITATTNVLDFGALIKAINQSACATPTTPAACLNKGIQMWSIGWFADYPDPQDFTTLQFDNGAFNNENNYGQNTSADAATQVHTQQGLEQADNMPAGPARLSAYNALEQQLVNDVAWLPLYQSTSPYVQKSYVIGTIANTFSGLPPDDWANIYIAVH